MVKSPQELALIERSAWITDRTIINGVRAARPGVSEAEVAVEMYGQLVGLGGPPSMPAWFRYLEDIPEEHMTWRLDRHLGPGPVLFECSGWDGGYNAPGSTSAWIGDPPKEFKEVMGRAREGFEAVCQAMVPGRAFSDVYNAWEAAVGGPEYERHHCGYMIGLGFSPSWAGTGAPPEGLRRGNGRLLEEGMAFHVISWPWRVGENSLRVGASRTVVVTKNGGKSLSKLPIEPILISDSRILAALSRVDRAGRAAARTLVGSRAVF